jgi:DNA-binding winged helix-turn-helix (wHTH) protein
LREQSGRQYNFGLFHLDADQHLLTGNGQAIALPPKCFGLLSLLVSSPGRLLEKDELIRALWPETLSRKPIFPI